MHITEEMLKVAVAKSVEAGLLPRRALKEDFYDAQLMMRAILQSTLDSVGAAEQEPTEQGKPRVPKIEVSAKKRRLVPVELQQFY